MTSRFTDEPVEAEEENRFTDTAPPSRFTDEPTSDAQGIGQVGKRVAQSVSKGVGDALYALGTDEVEPTNVDYTEEPEPYKDKDQDKPRAKVLDSGFANSLRENIDKAREGKITEPSDRNLMVKMRNASEDFTQEVDQDKGFDGGFKGFMEDVAIGFAEFGPSMAVTAANPVAGTISIYSQMYGGKYKDLVKQGVDEERANTAATIHAMLGTPAELAGNLLQIGIFKKLAKGIGVKIPITDRLRKYIGGIFLGGAGEGLEEGIQGYTELAADIYANAEEGDSAGTLMAAFTEMAASDEFKDNRNYSMAVGFTGGGLLPGMGAAINVGVDMSKKIKGIIAKNREKATSTEDGTVDPGPARGDLKDEPNISSAYNPVVDPETEVVPDTQPEITTDPTAISSGMSTEQVEGANKARIAQEKRQEQMKMEAAQKNQKIQIQKTEEETARKEQMVKAQKSDALKQSAIVAADNQRFMDSITTPQGLMDTASGWLQRAKEVPEHKETHKAIKSIHKALLNPENDNTSKLTDLMYEVTEAAKASKDTKVHALTDAFQIQTNDRISQIKRQEKAEEAQAELEKAKRKPVPGTNQKADAPKPTYPKTVSTTNRTVESLRQDIAKAAKGQPTVKLDKMKVEKTLQNARRSVAETERSKPKTVAKKPSVTKMGEELKAARLKKEKTKAKAQATFPFDPAHYGTKFKAPDPTNYRQIESLKDSMIHKAQNAKDLSTVGKTAEVKRINDWAKEQHKIGSANQTRFRKGKLTDGDTKLRKAELEKAIEPVNTGAKGALKTVVVETQDKLPKEALAKLKKGEVVKAIRHKDKVYMVAENTTDAKDAVKSWMHEQVGHHGLFKLFDSKSAEFGKFLDSATNVLKKDPAYEEIANAYANEIKELDSRDKNRFILEEVLAQRAEKLNPTRRKLVYQKFKDFLNKWLKKLFGEGGDFLNDFTITNKDIDTLLEAAKNRVLTGEVRGFEEFNKKHDEYKAAAKEVLKKNPNAITWYENHQTLLANKFGKDADLINVLFGITSAQTKVHDNAAFAIDTYLYMLDKVDKVGGMYPESVKTKVDAIMNGDAGKVAGQQYKIPEFIRALLGDEKATVNDRWMRRIFFGDVMLSEATAGSKDKADARESNFTVGEHAASRHEIFKLAKELTEETDHIWSPREVQAALWMKFASESKGKDVTEEFDYQIALNTPIPKYGGLTPLEYLESKTTKAEVGNLHKQIGGITFQPVSRLEKAYVQYLEKQGIDQIDKFSTDADIGMGIHYRKTTDLKKGEFILPAKLAGKTATYSVSDIQNRMLAHTKKNPYAPLVYFYESGATPETQVKTGAKFRYAVDFKGSKIYDLVNDAMDVSKKAKQRLKRDGGANIDNIRSNIIKDLGYDGYVTTAPTGTGRWVAMFKEAAVTYPSIDADIGISDVVEGLENLPQDIEELTKVVPGRFKDFQSYVNNKLKHYPEVNLMRFHPSIAQFGEATSAQMEISGSLMLNGPLGSIRALTAEMAIERSQRQVYVMHQEGKPTGMMYKFKVKKGIDSPAAIRKIADKHGLDDTNIGIIPHTGSLFIEQYVWPDTDLVETFKGFRDEIIDEYWPTNVTQKVNSEIHGFVKDEGDTATYSPDMEAELALTEFRKDLVKYYGEERAEEVYQAALKERSDYRSKLAGGVQPAGGNQGSTSIPYSPGKGLKFSKTPGPTFTETEQADLHKIGRPEDDGTARIDKHKQGILDKVIEYGVDSLHAIKTLEDKNNTPADLSGYKSFRMLSNFPSIIGSFLHEGRLKVEKASGWVYTEKEDQGGLYDSVKRLGDDADMFFRWMMAKSGQEMLDDGRSNLFGADSQGQPMEDAYAIALLEKETAPAYAANTELWDTERKRLADLNKSVLDLAEHSGIINSETRSDWERVDYIPFYRILDDIDGEDHVTTLFPGKGTKIGSIERLEGSKTKNVGDPMSNLVNAYSYLVNHSLKNLARTKTLNLANRAGLLTQKKTGGGKNVIDIRIDGETRHYRVEDPNLYDAMIEMDTVSEGVFGSNLIKFIATAPKKLLTAGVTVAPPFRVANIGRDTLQTAFMSKEFTPLVDSVRGVTESWTNSPEFVEYASTGGAFSGAYHERDVVGNTKKELDALKKRLNKGEMSNLNPIKPLKTVWDMWAKVGEASENAARMGLYMKLRKEGKSRFESGFEAKDLLDFHMSGRSKLVQILIQTVPFLNARVQGLYKVSKTGFTKNENLGRFWLAGGMMSLAATALHFYNDDEEWYQDLGDHERLSYFNFKIGPYRFKLPSPFEVGSIFGVAPTAFYDWAKGHKDGRQVAQFFTKMFTEIFSLGSPQAVKLFTQQSNNKDSYTGIPIESRRDQSVDPQLRYNNRTSKVARGIGNIVKDIPIPQGMKEYIGSPKRIDKFMKDLFSYFAIATMAGTDVAAGWINDYPEDPATQIGDRYLTGVGRFVKEGVPRHVRQERQFYDMLLSADKAWATFDAYNQDHKRELAREFREKNRGRMRVQSGMSSAQKTVRTLNNKIKMIQASTKYTADEKRERIDDTLLRRHKVIKRAVEKFYEKYKGGE